jgi:hypothetical protein
LEHAEYVLVIFVEAHMVRPLFLLGISSFAAGCLSLLNLPQAAGPFAVIIWPVAIILVLIGLFFLGMMSVN